MRWDVAGLGNALMDALVVIEDDAILERLGLRRGIMHPVDHDRWIEVYEQLADHRFTFDSGGSCANTIATVGRLGGRAIYCGQVGDDQMGRQYASLMNEACGEHALRFTTEQATGKCLSIISAADAERTMLTDLGAAVSLPRLGDFAETVVRARIAHFTGYTLLDGPMQAVALEAIRLAHAADVKISLDAADPFVVELTRDLLWEVIDRYVDIMFLNRDEARMLTGISDPERCIRAIADRATLQTTIIKLGKEGSLVHHDGELHRIAVHAVHAVDTTGAGDAYAGGYLYGHTSGFPPERCGRLASTVAALAVSQIGAVVKDEVALAKAVVDSGTDGAAA